jgi:hypothetical protein
MISLIYQIDKFLGQEIFLRNKKKKLRNNFLKLRESFKKLREKKRKTA